MMDKLQVPQSSHSWAVILRRYYSSTKYTGFSYEEENWMYRQMVVGGIFETETEAWKFAHKFNSNDEVNAEVIPAFAPFKENPFGKVESIHDTIQLCNEGYMKAFLTPGDFFKEHQPPALPSGAKVAHIAAQIIQEKLSS